LPPPPLPVPLLGVRCVVVVVRLGSGTNTPVRARNCDFLVTPPGEEGRKKRICVCVRVS
uniref:Uncharacterized protein n=1 Tax=Anopheles arabiensis TaxID=7173 RepID=A0A182IHH7_ANOAR